MLVAAAGGARAVAAGVGRGRRWLAGGGAGVPLPRLLWPPLWAALASKEAGARLGPV